MARTPTSHASITRHEPRGHRDRRPVSLVPSDYFSGPRMGWARARISSTYYTARAPVSRPHLLAIQSPPLAGVDACHPHSLSLASAPAGADRGQGPGFPSKPTSTNLTRPPILIPLFLHPRAHTLPVSIHARIEHPHCCSTPCPDLRRIPQVCSRDDAPEAGADQGAGARTNRKPSSSPDRDDKPRTHSPSNKLYTDGRHEHPPLLPLLAPVGHKAALGGPPKSPWTSPPALASLVCFAPEDRCRRRRRHPLPPPLPHPPPPAVGAS